MNLPKGTHTVSDTRQDLTEYSDKEMSLLVFNDETLYRMRRSIGFITFLKELYKATDEQWEVLKEDLKDDENET